MSRFATLLTLAIAGSASAVVIRDDVNDAKYRLASSEFRPLADLPGEGHGVLIAPQWVVTAAHAVAWQDKVDTVVIDGASRKVEKVIFHGGYKKLPQELVDAAIKAGDATPAMDFLASSDDIALVKLTMPVSDVQPARILSAAAAGSTVEIIGKGATGTGSLGHNPQGPNRTELRHAFSTLSTSQGRWMSYEFRQPPGALPMEGSAGNGDSGGPLLITVQGERQLVGLTSWKRVSGNPSEFRPGRYGQVNYAVRLAHYLDWMQATMASGGTAPSPDGR
jgi:secreted trypsin-like serine protease